MIWRAKAYTKYIDQYEKTQSKVEWFETTIPAIQTFPASPERWKNQLNADFKNRIWKGRKRWGRVKGKESI